MINIAIVDDHRLFVSALRSLIESFFSNYHILFDASNGEDLMRKITPKHKPEIILLDLNMPVKNGYETTEWLSENYPDIRIIILSMTDCEETVLKLIKSGIKGYLLKDAEPEEFKIALDAVCFGGIYYPKFVTQHLANYFNNPISDNPPAKLNEKELEFLRLSATELTYKEIADKLCVSVRTVDGYRDHLFNKLNVKSRIGLAVYAIKNEICQL